MVTISRVVVRCLCLLLLSSVALSQGEFLRGSESGFGVGVGIIGNSLSTTTSFSVGYAAQGIVDFGLSAGSFSYPESNYRTGSASVIGSSLTIYASREDSVGRKPNVGLSLGFAHVSGSLDGDAWAFGVDISKKVQQSETFFIMPSGGISVSIDVAHSETNPAITFGVSLGTTGNSMKALAITPVLIYHLGVKQGTNDEVSYGVSLTLVI